MVIIPKTHSTMRFSILKFQATRRLFRRGTTWISKNPDLKILCAHMGSMSHDVDMIAERLDKFENMYVEPAARFGDLGWSGFKKG